MHAVIVYNRFLHNNFLNELHEHKYLVFGERLLSFDVKETFKIWMDMNNLKLGDYGNEKERIRNFGAYYGKAFRLLEKQSQTII